MFKWPKNEVLTKSFTGVDKFLSRHSTFRALNFTYAPDQTRKKMGGQNQSVCPIETQLETLSFVL